MAPSKRRKRSAATEPTSADASSSVQTRRSVSVQCDLPDARDADLDAEPEELICPITRTMFRDPVMVLDSGHTYERSAVLAHFRRNGAKDPLTRRALSSTKVMTIWALRNVVQAWLDRHPDVTPDGWDSRELLEPSKDDETRTFDDEDDVGVLRTWRAMCPELQERWPEAARPEHWEGVTMENGRVVKLELEDFDLTGVVPAELGRLSALRKLSLHGNELTSLPAEIGQLTSLEGLRLFGNQLTSVPAEIGQLTALRELSLAANRLMSVPAEIGQLTSLRELNLNSNQLTNVPAEIGQLTSLEGLRLYGNRLTSVPEEIGQLTSLVVLVLGGNQFTSVPAEIGQLTALRELRLDGNRLTSVPAEIGQLTSLGELSLSGNQLTSVPAEIGQLTLLKGLELYYNQLTSLPAEIGQLTSLEHLLLDNNQLTSVPAEIRELRAAGCRVDLDDGVTMDEEDDARVLRAWRAMCCELQERWPEASPAEHWEGVTMENGRVVKLDLVEFGLIGALPAEVGRLSALRWLQLGGNNLTSVPAEIGQLTSLMTFGLSDNKLTSVPAEIGQLTSLEVLYLDHNRLASMPAEIGRLTSLTTLFLSSNRLTSVPAEIGQLTSLKGLHLSRNQLTSVPAAIRDLRAAGCRVHLDDCVTVDDEGDVGALRTWRAMCPELQGMWPEDEQPEDWEGVRMENGRVVKLELEDCDLTGLLPAEIGCLGALRLLQLAGNELTSVPAEIGQLTSLEVLELSRNKLTSVPVEIGQLTSLERLYLSSNRLTSLPAEIGQLTSLKRLYLDHNQLTSVPAEIGQLAALQWFDLQRNELTSVPAEIGQLLRGRLRSWNVDDGVTVDE